MRAYFSMMRLYYAAVTGFAGWCGVAYAAQFYPVSWIRYEIALLLLFLSWGVNQVINDWLGLKEDRINAPYRPLVTGEAGLVPTLCVTVVLLGGLGLGAFFLHPLALIPAVVGIILNVVYEYAKGVVWLGPLVFGVMIGMCSWVGFFAVSDGEMVTADMWRGLTGWLLIVLANAIMTYFTYFKDRIGDEKAGKVTFIVRYGEVKSGYVGIGLCCGIGLLTLCGGLGVATTRLSELFFVFVAISWVLLGIATSLRTKDRLSLSYRRIAGLAILCCEATSGAIVVTLAPHYTWSVVGILLASALVFFSHRDSRS